MAKFILIFIVITSQNLAFCCGNNILESKELINVEKIKDIHIKRIEKNVSLNDENCHHWVFDENDFIDAFMISDQISFPELNYLYDNMNCTYNGEFTYEEELFSFELNAGGWIRIDDNSDNNLILGCHVALCKKYFLSLGGREEGL